MRADCMEGFIGWFCTRFFPLIVQDDMERKFIELRQEGGMADAHAIEFSRPSRFVPTIVVEERDQERRFQHVLSSKI